ncbi:MAG TPA: PaaI family thioesterase [Caulobacteraceae bacterium]
MKCNFTGALREGAAVCEAQLLHGGRTTQVWDASIRDEASGKLMAAFRCTQIILYPRT